MPTYFLLLPAFLQTLSPYYDISVLPAGREWKVTGRALALAGSGYVNLPTSFVLCLLLAIALQKVFFAVAITITNITNKIGSTPY